MMWLMKRLVGFGVPDWLAAVLIFLAWCVLCVGAVWLIYNAGQRDGRADWQAKEAVELANAKADIKRLNFQNQALGQLSLGLATAAKTHYEQELTHEKTNFNRIIADVRAGAKRLSIATKAVPACSGGISLTAATRPAAAEETRAELSEAAAEFIVRFGNEADEAVIEGNYVKDLLQQCHTHVKGLQQMMSPPPLTALALDFSQGN